MQKLLGKTALAITISLAFLAFLGTFNPTAHIEEKTAPAIRPQEFRVITGNVKKGETLFDIFRKNNLDIAELYKIRAASAGIHKLRELHPGRPYKITRDANEQLHSFVYRIDDDRILNVSRTETGYCAERIPIDYERNTLHIGGEIQGNLISSLGEGNERLLLALQLSDIFAWDIDFTTDLRNGDTFKVVVEELREGGRFKKYGRILSAEFINKGELYRAYAFEQQGKIDYYDEQGKSLRKAFLKAPLSFRRISSSYSVRRFHPVLKIYRPHHGLDYSAAKGTPVSAAGDGRCVFAGRRGQYGNLIIIKHRNGYSTYYGHLSKIARGVRGGANVAQGDIIGYVGATGLATGPHLHYEMRINNRAVNPMAVKLPQGEAVPANMLAAFNKLRDEMNGELASAEFSGAVAVDTSGKPEGPG